MRFALDTLYDQSYIEGEGKVIMEYESFGYELLLVPVEAEEIKAEPPVHVLFGTCEGDLDSEAIDGLLAEYACFAS